MTHLKIYNLLLLISLILCSIFNNAYSEDIDDVISYFQDDFNWSKKSNSVISYSDKMRQIQNNYPLLGFWKQSPNDEFYLFISPAVNGNYHISTCGSDGCFQKGNTPDIVNFDKSQNYRVIDNNKLQFTDADGKIIIYKKYNNPTK